MLPFRSIALLSGLFTFSLFGGITKEIPGIKEENKMFVVIVKYKKSLEEVNKLVLPHLDFLQKCYDRSEIICSGPQNPRVGGVILANVDSKEYLWSLIKQDPFYIHEIADYEVIEFIPTMYDEQFAGFLKNP